jgi:site-specific recombinase XerD
MLLSRAIEGYYLHAEAEGLSKHTVRDYRQTFERFLRFVGDRPVTGIGKTDIEEFSRSLNAGRAKPLSEKTRLNYYIGLSALWTWLKEEGVVETQVVRQLKWPKPADPAISPLSRDDVRLLLAAVERSRPYSRNFQREPCTHANPNSLRNRVLILTLLDTGMRVSELCNLQVRDVDFRNREIEIREGKGDKGRYVPISARTGKELWKYLGTRRTRDDDPIFADYDGFGLSSRGVEMMLQRLAKKAGVKKANPHRFRHTFAINYLRNGGDAFTLQKILGHSDMAMVRRYLDLARADVSARHHAASPVANWGI